MTFARACSHFLNYTVGHESRKGWLAAGRFPYPDNHIEVDNRLSWMIGRLVEAHPDSVYVHLTRNQHATAESYASRTQTNRQIMRAYHDGILMVPSDQPRRPLSVAHDMIGTVNSNIRLALRDLRRTFEIQIENPDLKFYELADLIGADGDIRSALAEFRTCYNKTDVSTTKGS